MYNFSKIILISYIMLFCAYKNIFASTIEQKYWTDFIRDNDGNFVGRIDPVDVTQPARAGIKYVALIKDNNVGGSSGRAHISIFCNSVLKINRQIAANDWEECGENESIRILINVGIQSDQMGTILSIPTITRGDRGEPGINGTDGAKGEKGDIGLQGPPGINGTDGINCNCNEDSFSSGAVAAGAVGGASAAVVVSLGVLLINKLCTKSLYVDAESKEVYKH